MNTERKSIKRPLCEKCGEVFMVVGSTAIRLAFPRPVTYNQDMREDTGICPKHPRSLGNEHS
jgi:hypothetical protein